MEKLTRELENSDFDETLYTHVGGGGVNRFRNYPLRPKKILKGEITLYIKRSFFHFTIYLENYLRYQKIFHTKVL